MSKYFYSYCGKFTPATNSGHIRKHLKTKTMKSFLIMVAAVVVGVIVARLVQTKILKQAA